MSKHEIWIAQQSGGAFFPLDPRPEDVCLTSLAIAMRHLNRYNGQTLLPMPVGPHSMLVARLVRLRWSDDVEAHLYAYLHDIHEVLWGDLLRPVQKVIEQWFPGFMAKWDAETAKTDRVFFEALGLPPEFPSEQARRRIKEADGAALFFERRVLIGPPEAFVQWPYDDLATWWLNTGLDLHPLCGGDWNTEMREALHIYKAAR